MSVNENLEPKVSIIMSIYNEEQYLSEAIESILHQTFRDYEFIIINDGSVDRTHEIIKRYMEKDKRIRVIDHEKKEGLARSLNDGIRIAQGKYIARMDGDDISLPQRFERQIDFMEAHPEVGALGTYFKEIDENGNILPRKQNPILWKDIGKALFHYNPIGHPSAMMKKSILEKLGGYDESFHTAQDYELFCRIAEVSQLRNLPEILLLRRFPRKVSSRKMRQQTIDSLRAQVLMLKRRVYPWYYFIFLIKTLVAFIIPVSIREKIRRWRHRRYG